MAFQRRVYMDHAATTPVDPEVVEAIVPYFTEIYGNASSLHSFGREAHNAMEEARRKVARLINARPEEIIFTAGGTESDNMAIKGVAYANRSRGDHIITSTIEHPAVLETCRSLEKQGFKVSYVSVDKDGLIELDSLRKAVTERTILVTIMHANNEIGTIEPIEEIAEIAGTKNIVFHTDAVQSAGKIPIDVKEIGVDLLSISAHKIYGPKGIGALYVRKGTRLEPIIHGGGHEGGLRSSTENIPGIVGLGKATELAERRMSEDTAHLTMLRDQLIKETLSDVEESYLNGHPTKRLPNNAHFRFTGIEGEALVLNLDEKGIAASTGSACSSKKLLPSHVLMAIGLDEVQAHGSLRLTLGRENTKEDIEYVLQVLPETVKKLRAISPLWGRPIETERWKKELEAKPHSH
jgi:cysteine desulfurase